MHFSEYFLARFILPGCYVETMKETTQEKIAQQLGVSRSTVSRVLRNVTGPKSSTAARIIETAREMGYRLPATENTAARKGVGRRKETLVGLLMSIPDESTSQTAEVPMRVLRGATDAARERDVLIHVEYIKVSDCRRIAAAKDLPASLRKKTVSGVLLMGEMSTQAVSLIAERKPCVRMMVHDPGISLDLVGQDDRTAVRDLVMLLKEQGHRNIGYYCRSPKASYALSRFSGYVEALALTGLPYDHQAVINIWEYSGETALAAAGEAANRGVTAWICSHDDCGYELIRHFRSMGLQVPRDISVCGFDHLPVPEGMSALATINWPLEDIAAAGVGLLLRRINEPARAQAQLQFGGRLIEGETVGPAASL
jgi:LacI family transcriptional regulator